MDVLDVGCGAGFAVLTLALRERSIRLVGLDVNEDQIIHARAIAAAAGLSNATFVTDFSEVPRRTFDLALCIDTIEYVEDPERLLRDVRDCLHPGGSILIHCRRTPTPRVFGRFTSLDPFEDERLREGYSEDELESLLVEAGFTVDDLRATMRLTSELGFELTHPIHGFVRGRVVRHLLTPLLAALARFDAGGFGAGLLALGHRS
jgi:cyclopropane fatty-acyl-phospholipid synthase-like methyltransferase